jgi:hypothetical protein
MGERRIRRAYRTAFLSHLRFKGEDSLREGDVSERERNLVAAHWSAFALAVEDSHPQWVVAPSPQRVELEAELLEPWARKLLNVGAAEVLTRGDPQNYPKTMFTHGSELLHPYYLRSPGTLLTVFVETMPHGPGIAELAEDGLRFIGGSLHHWPWEILKSWSEEIGGTILIRTKPGGGGYWMAVDPGAAKHGWAYLLPNHGVEQEATAEDA